MSHDCHNYVYSAEGKVWYHPETGPDTIEEQAAAALASIAASLIRIGDLLEKSQNDAQAETEQALASARERARG